MLAAFIFLFKDTFRFERSLTYYAGERTPREASGLLPRLRRIIQGQRRSKQVVRKPHRDQVQSKMGQL